jgi:hypothetical protein
MIHTPEDLVVRLDEKNARVLFLVPKSSENTDQLKLFYSVDDLRRLPKEDLAKELGIALLAFLQATYSQPYLVNGDNDFRAGDDADETPHSDQSDEVSVGFDDARAMINRLGVDSCAADLEAIDVLLATAANQGDADAQNYLAKTWPDLRAVFARRLARGN